MSLLRKLLVENSIKPSVITYTTTDGNIITPHDGVFLDAGGNQAKIASNTYENGQGTMVFDRAIYSVKYYDNNQWATLKTIVLDDSIKVLNPQCFYLAEHMVEVQLPNYLKKVYYTAFGGTYKLKRLRFPNTIQYFDGNVIGNGNTMEELSIDEGCERYMSSNNCIIQRTGNILIMGIGISIIPDFVEAINKSSFNWCLALSSIKINKNIHTISNGAFHCICQGLKEIIVDPDNPYFYVEGNCLIRKSDKTVIVGCATPNIPDDILTIGASAFGNIILNEITIPSNIKEIGQYAFYAASITKYKFLSSEPPTIMAETFGNCRSNMKIYVPDDSIENYKAADIWKNTVADRIYSLSEY